MIQPTSDFKDDTLNRSTNANLDTSSVAPTSATLQNDMEQRASRPPETSKPGFFESVFQTLKRWVFGSDQDTRKPQKQASR